MRRDDDQPDRRRDVTGLDQGAPQAAPIQLPFGQTDQQRDQRADTARLGRREHAAIDPAHHGKDEKHHRPELGRVPAERTPVPGILIDDLVGDDAFRKPMRPH
jgi:hypothetical protein